MTRSPAGRPGETRPRPIGASPCRVGGGAGLLTFKSTGGPDEGSGRRQAKGCLLALTVSVGSLAVAGFFGWPWAALLVALGPLVIALAV